MPQLPYLEASFAWPSNYFPCKTVEVVKIGLLYSMAPVRSFSLCCVLNDFATYSVDIDVVTCVPLVNRIESSRFVVYFFGYDEKLQDFQRTKQPSILQKQRQQQKKTEESHSTKK